MGISFILLQKHPKPYEGHEQTNYERSNFIVRLNFQICRPYQLG
jgi:hypothetical protein